MSDTSPQENQPGEAAKENPILKEARKMGFLDGTEPQAECHTSPNVEDGVKMVPHPLMRTFDGKPIMIPAEQEMVFVKRTELDDLRAERAKRLELEGELARIREDCQRVCSTVASMHAAAVGEVTGPKRGVIEDVADIRAELLELRAKVGQTDLVGPEEKEDGEMRPRSARDLALEALEGFYIAWNNGDFCVSSVNKAAKRAAKVITSNIKSSK